MVKFKTFASIGVQIKRPFLALTKNNKNSVNIYKKHISMNIT